MDDLTNRLNDVERKLRWLMWSAALMGLVVLWLVWHAVRGGPGRYQVEKMRDIPVFIVDTVTGEVHPLIRSSGEGK